MRSSLSPIQSYQQGPRTVHATSAHGFGHGVSNITRKGFSKVTLSRCVLDVSPLTNLPGAKAPGLSHSHRRAVTSPACRRSRVRMFSLCASGALSMQRRGSRPMAAHSCPRKPINQLVAYRVTIHNRVLSNALVLAGPQPSEASNGRVPKPTRAFHEKEGELPNVGC